MYIPKKENYQVISGVLYDVNQSDFVARTCQGTCLGNCNAPMLLEEV